MFAPTLPSTRFAAPAILDWAVFSSAPKPLNVIVNSLLSIVTEYLLSNSIVLASKLKMMILETGRGFLDDNSKSVAVPSHVNITVPVGSGRLCDREPKRKQHHCFHKLRSKLAIQVSIADLALLIFSSVGGRCIILESTIPTIPRASSRRPPPDKFRTATR
jgi:hypothetical protein